MSFGAFIYTVAVLTAGKVKNLKLKKNFCGKVSTPPQGVLKQMNFMVTVDAFRGSMLSMSRPTLSFPKEPSDLT
jgi:hypothetical protein